MFRKLENQGGDFSEEMQDEIYVMSESGCLEKMEVKDDVKDDQAK